MCGAWHSGGCGCAVRLAVVLWCVVAWSYRAWFSGGGAWWQSQNKTKIYAQKMCGAWHSGSRVVWRVAVEVENTPNLRTS